MSFVEIKNLIALIDNKPFFDQSTKDKQEAYGKLVEMSRNNDCVTGKLLHYLYHQNYYKLIGIDLSRQTNITIPHKLILQENWRKMMVQQCFLLLETSKTLF